MIGETIAAIATPLGAGGIGIVRISGDEAILVAEKVLRLAGSKRLSDMRGYTCAYGRAFDEQGDIDEVVATVFRAPHSFTGENTVEIASHGGVYLVGRILQASLKAGARPAQAGEFTKRAFLSGKLDLTQAEAVADLIGAQGAQAARAALSARDGALFGLAEQVIAKLTGYAAHLSAWIDYPEEDIAEVDAFEILEGLKDAREILGKLLAEYDTGKVIREGIDVAIVGRPNVGKSTLMNLLSGYRRSIVNETAGTTRDVVTDTVRLGDIVLHLADTAGIRDAVSDPIERAGVDLTYEKLERAQLVLAVFDGSDSLTDDDLRVIERCKGLTAVALINKNDLPQKLELDAVRSAFSHVVEISAKERAGAGALQEKIEQLFALGSFDASAAMLANERQRANVNAAYLELLEAVEAIRAGVSYDAVGVCIERALDALLELTGKRASEEVIEQVFAQFCVGK